MENNGQRKFDFRGIRFRTWGFFALFSLIIVGTLFMLQTYSLRPYYRSVKINTVQNISDKVDDILASNSNIGENLSNLSYDNKICMSVYNHERQEMLSVNGMGLGCQILSSSSFDADSFIDQVTEQKEVSLYQMDERFSDETLIYGTQLDTVLDRFFIIINTTVEPVDSTVFIIRNQFILIAFIVLIFSVLIAFYFSALYSRPITEITKGANNIARGHYKEPIDEHSFTEFKELSQTLNYTAQELSKTEELRRELLANVSHDIKTPLTTIKAYAEMIQDISGDIPAKRNEHLNVIISETNHLNKLVNDMMTLTKVQSGNLSIDIVAFDLCELADEILSLLKATADHEQVELKINMPERAVVYGDRMLVGQVIYNFVNNAIKHCGEDKLVMVRIIPDDENWRLEVEDHGIGIDEEELPYIWERYYKANLKYQREQAGSGLGLAISKAYLDLHNYRFGVKTKRNAGSTFYFIALTDEQEVYKVL